MLTYAAEDVHPVTTDEFRGSDGHYRSHKW
jgi:hypothetical protein